MQPKRKLKRRCRSPVFALLNIRNLHKIALALFLLALIISINGQDDNPEADPDPEPDPDADAGGGQDVDADGAGDDASDAAGGGGDGQGDDDKNKDDDMMAREGHGTTHEQLGQAHYPLADLTAYESHAVYETARNHTTWLMHPAYNITHFIFDILVNNKPALPPGYLVVKNESTLALGPKVEQNDWSDLLADYFIIIIFVIILLLMAIIMPFIAVCYCCFCCCRRCKLGCGPCDGPRDKRSASICVILLILLLIVLLIGLLIAFVATRFLDRGFDDTTNTMRRGTQDTCTFLQDIANHIHHVMVYNYEELEAHLTGVLSDAANHIFLDVGDASESNAITELERILDNMPEALRILQELEHMENDLRFNVVMLRDGVRGLKRDVTYTCSILLASEKCKDLLMNSMLQFIDTSTCLHLDKLPFTKIYIEGVKEILKENVAQIPKRALERFQKVGDKIAVAMEAAVPPLRMDISRGHDLFQQHAAKVRNLVEQLISDLHFRTLQSTKAFEDIHDKLGTERNTLSMIVCLFIFLVFLSLVAALIFGCCINKITGGHFLLLAMILIFCIFSLILIMAVFYFIIGLIAYQGACAPLRDHEGNALFSQLDTEMDLNRFLPASGADRESAPLRMSTAIKTCMANQSIFQLLLSNKIYDPDDLMSLKVLSEDQDDEKRGLKFEDDLSQVYLFTLDEIKKLEDARTGNLSEFRSTQYAPMCTPLTPDLKAIMKALTDLSNQIHSLTDNWDDYNRVGRISLKNEAMHLYMYEQKYASEILRLIEGMRKRLLKVDELILYENRNFTNSIEVLVNAVLRAERFLKSQGNTFINSLGGNLTDVLNYQIELFIEGVVHECNTNIGRCSPLAYIYYRGVDLICYRLVDPLNAFWLGLLICCIAFIPLLFVAHRLMCLWRRLHSYIVAPIAMAPISGCPACTGAPYVPPPIITCTGGQETFCVCSEGRQNRTDGGAAPSESSMHANDVAIVEDSEAFPATTIAVVSAPPVAPKTSKRKED
ncbi:hypothetical protein KR044_009393 [Drosophila immigrans]|nr:hypothetical protein KR044_009393 [Drosophila immigrans]